MAKNVIREMNGYEKDIYGAADCFSVVVSRIWKFTSRRFPLENGLWTWKHRVSRLKTVGIDDSSLTEDIG